MRRTIHDDRCMQAWESTPDAEAVDYDVVHCRHIHWHRPDSDLGDSCRMWKPRPLSFRRLLQRDPVIWIYLGAAAAIPSTLICMWMLAR